MMLTRICSAQRKNRHKSGIVLRNITAQFRNGYGTILKLRKGSCWECFGQSENLMFELKFGCLVEKITMAVKSKLCFLLILY